MVLINCYIFLLSHDEVYCDGGLVCIIILGRRMSSNVEKDNDLVSTSKHGGSTALGGTAYEVGQNKEEDKTKLFFNFLPLKILQPNDNCESFGGGG